MGVSPILPDSVPDGTQAMPALHIEVLQRSWAEYVIVGRGHEDGISPASTQGKP